MRRCLCECFIFGCFYLCKSNHKYCISTIIARVLRSFISSLFCNIHDDMAHFYSIQHNNTPYINASFLNSLKTIIAHFFFFARVENGYIWNISLSEKEIFAKKFAHFPLYTHCWIKNWFARIPTKQMAEICRKIHKCFNFFG